MLRYIPTYIPTWVTHSGFCVLSVKTADVPHKAVGGNTLGLVFKPCWGSHLVCHQEKIIKDLFWLLLQILVRVKDTKAHLNPFRFPQEAGKHYFYFLYRVSFGENVASCSPQERIAIALSAQHLYSKQTSKSLILGNSCHHPTQILPLLLSSAAFHKWFFCPCFSPNCLSHGSFSPVESTVQYRYS